MPAGRGRTFRAGVVEDLRARLDEMVDEVRRADHQRLPPDQDIPSIAAQYEDFRRRYRGEPPARS